MGKQVEQLLRAYTAKRQEQGEFQAHCDAQEAELLAAIPAEIRDALARVAEARILGGASLDQEIDTLAAQLKSAVGAKGHSVKGTEYHVVYAAGRVTWDAKALEGYAAAHEELYQFRHEAEPVISIRRVK